jgi:hypothetical protein
MAAGVGGTPQRKFPERLLQEKKESVLTRKKRMRMKGAAQKTLQARQASEVQERADSRETRKEENSLRREKKDRREHCR